MHEQKMHMQAINLFNLEVVFKSCFLLPIQIIDTGFKESDKYHRGIIQNFSVFKMVDKMAAKI